MRHIILGIDPGLSGGIGWIDAPNGEGLNYVGAIQTPLTGGEIDCGTIVDWLGMVFGGPSAVRRVFIEKVGAMPKQGLSSTFKFGKGYGQIIGMCQALKLSFSLITPQAWKKEVLAGTDHGKDAAIAFCRAAFPTVNLIPDRCRVPSDGMGDALCIAEYGRRTLL